jgi:DNA-binding NtrC family response regulator
MDIPATGVKGEARKALEEGIEKGLPLAQIARLYMFDMLERKGGNKCHTSEALGIDRRTVQRWIKGQYQPKWGRLGCGSAKDEPVPYSVRPEAAAV